MGAIKSNQYTSGEKGLFLTTRAFAHPARIRMVKLIRNGNEMRNLDLCRELNLSKTSIKNHLQMLKDADLVRIEYLPHCYKVSLNKKGIESSRKILAMEES